VGLNMGKFTDYDDPRVDTFISSQLDIVVRIIEENVPGVKSIILWGSFGRGEGSIEVVGNNVTPLKDYDVLVVVDRMPNIECRRKVSNNISSEFRLRERKNFKFSSFVVDVGYINKTLLKYYLDITLWELKHGSTVLYGDDVRPTIPWNIEDIPLSNGLRFLFEKVTGLIAHFSQEYVIDDKMGKEKSRMLIYECYKTYVEIASVLCLAMKCYAPYYRKRMDLFEINFEKMLPQLSKQIPNLHENVIKATNFKLRPSFKNITASPIDLWFQTRDALSIVLEYYLYIALDVRLAGWIESYSELCRGMAFKYYRPLIRAVLGRLGIRSKLLVDMANMLFLIYQKFRTVFSLWGNHGTLYLRPLRQVQSPLMTLYLSSVLILLSLRKDGEIDIDYFKEALRNLEDVLPVRLDRESSWDDLRDLYIKAYEMHRGGPK